MKWQYNQLIWIVKVVFKASQQNQGRIERLIHFQKSSKISSADFATLTWGMMISDKTDKRTLLEDTKCGKSQTWMILPELTLHL